MYISKPIYAWLIISSLIVIWDASYVLLRPHSLKGGQYQQFYAPYQQYIKFDTLYAGNSDKFVVIQSWLNLAEITLTFVAVALSLYKCRSANIKGALLAMIVSGFIFWKTVIYVWYAHPFLTEDAINFTTESLYLFYLPTSFWLICPVLTMISISGKIRKELLKGVGVPKGKKE